jgi:hypothetical protein
MEPRFHHDFSKVRVHTDDQAAASAHALNALAYTVGNHLVFAAGQYRSHRTEGRKLLAHELAHVVQQQGVVPGTNDRLSISSSQDQSEREADTIANAITLPFSGPRPRPASIAQPKIQRACATCEDEEEKEKAKKKNFSYADLSGGEEKEEMPEATALPEKPMETHPTSGPEAERPHFVDATIKCESGDYVVKLNDWGGKPCGISDCVTVHESSHITDWRARWPNGCKKADGSNQPDGYLPTGGDGYAAFLKTSECTAHTKDLECAEKKRDAATGDCKTKLDDYAKLTKAQRDGPKACG